MTKISLTKEFLINIRKIAGLQISDNAAILTNHAEDESHHYLSPPELVVFPKKTSQVVEIVKLCAAHKVPLIPYGSGTSLEGGIGAPLGGVCIDLSQMNRVLRVNTSDMDVTVEPGVTRKTLNAYLRDTGLFFPVDPGADATLGGMASTRASGTNAVRYGTMRENILNLTAVLADGRIVKSGNRARKSAAGYDLARLFIGAEGTLGIITELTLRLYGLPEAVSVAVVQFPSIKSAVETATATVQSGISIARLELLDAAQMRACIDYSALDYNPAPTLFLEFHGSPRMVREHAETVQLLAEEHDGESFQWADTAEERTKLWQARHDALYAAIATRPGSKAWSTDVCVPVSNLALCIEETRKDIEKAKLPATIVGHVGDGNFHVIFLLDPDQPREMRAAKSVNKKMIARAIELEGTCTGEHGVGIGKRDSLALEMGSALEIMSRIKKALDPAGIMNPGKIL